MEAYIEALLAMNEHINLTAKQSFDEAWRLHVLDSAAVQQLPTELQPQAQSEVVDIGSGNGFPGVMLAAEFPECRVTLIERRQKKARAIGQLIEQTGLENVQSLACDARELKNHKPKLVGAVDIVTARAVGPLSTLIKLARPMLKGGGHMIFWKSQKQCTDEWPEALKTCQSLKLPEPVRHSYQIEDFRDACLVVIQRPKSSKSRASQGKRRGPRRGPRKGPRKARPRRPKKS